MSTQTQKAVESKEQVNAPVLNNLVELAAQVKQAKKTSIKIEAQKKFKDAFNEQFSLSGLVRWINSDKGIAAFNKFIAAINKHNLSNDKAVQVNLVPAQITVKFLKLHNSVKRFQKLTAIKGEFKAVDRFTSHLIVLALNNCAKGVKFDHLQELQGLIEQE